MKQRFFRYAALAIALAASCAGPLHGAHRGRKDESPYRLILKDLSGKKHSVSEFQGQVLVLNFWATWCGPCKDELPMLNELAQKYAASRVVFLAASIDDRDGIKDIPKFLAQHNVTLTVWTGATAGTIKKLGLGEIIPATMVLDQNGNVAGRIMGEARRDDITSRLDWIANGESGDSPAPVVKRF